MNFIVMMPVYAASYIYDISRNVNFSTWFDKKNDTEFNNDINGIFAVTLYQVVFVLGTTNILQFFDLLYKFTIEKIPGILAIVAISLVNYIYFVVKNRGKQFSIFFRAAQQGKKIAIRFTSAIFFIIGLAGLAISVKT